MKAAQTRKSDPLTEAWRYSAALKAAIAAGRHNCRCGQFGAHRFEGRWFCRACIAYDASGSFRPIPNEAQS